MKSKTSTLAAASIAALLAAAPALAQQAAPLAASQEASVVPAAAVLQDMGNSERIDYTGKLRMLSQRIPAAACTLAAGVAPEEAGKLLGDVTAEFDRIVHALRFGDADLGIIGEEKRKKTLFAINALEQRWSPMETAALALAEGDASADHLGTILASNLGVLEDAAVLVSVMVAQYSDPADMILANSILIDIAGRQRMLSQKMSKESCMIWSGHATAETVNDLANTMTIFESSLLALRTGMRDAGINPPPNAEIEAGLSVVFAEWSEVKPVLERLKAGESPDEAQKAETFLALNTMMADMNKVVGLYAEAAKQGS